MAPQIFTSALPILFCRSFIDKNFSQSGLQMNSIQVSNIPIHATHHDIAQFFGCIGEIKLDPHTQQPLVQIFTNKRECLVTFANAETAQNAVGWFNGFQMNGHTLKVTLSRG